MEEKIKNIWHGKIKEEYEKILIIPVLKPSPQFMVCPIGLPGSGKTAVMKSLSEKFPIIRIHADQIKILLKKYNHSIDFAFTIAGKYIKKYLEAGYSIGIDGDCANPITVEKILKEKEKYGLKIIWLHVNTSEDFIIKKLSQINYTWGIYNDAQDAIKDYFFKKQLHQNLNFPFLYTFDISKKDFPIQIEEAVKKINAYLRSHQERAEALPPPFRPF